MNKVLSVVLVCSSILGFTSVSFAQTLKLKDSVREILDTNPKVLEKLKDYNASVFERNRGKAGFRPSIDISAQTGHEQSSNSSTRFQDKYHWISSGNISLKQMITDGGYTRNNIHAKSSLAKARLFDYCNEANTVAYQSIEAYINLLKYDRLEKLAIENVNIHKKILESVKARSQAGTGSNAELTRVQGRLAAAQSKLIARHNDYKKAVYKFHQFIGRYVDASELVRPTFNSSWLPANLKKAFEIQTKNHPSIIAADFNIDAQKWQYKRDKSTYSPSLNFRVSRGLQRDYAGVKGDNDDTRIMLELSYSLYDGGERKELARKNRSLIHKQQQVRYRIKRSELTDLQLTWTGYKLLDSQIGALRKNMFYTREALNSYKEEFNLGKRNLINILDAENEYQNSRAMLAATEFDLISSKYRVLFSMGTLLENLKLTSPLIEELKKIKRVRPVSEDRLPLNPDFDADKILNKNDISDNSLKGDKVNSLGANVIKTGKYLEDPIDTNVSGNEIYVTKKADLDKSSFKTDVAIKLDLISFKKGSIELSDESKVIMRSIIKHLKPLAMDGVIQITVSSKDMKTSIENYNLALRRAYNIKHIFAMHNMDKESIQVFVDKKQSKYENSFTVKVVTNLKDFKKGYRTISNIGVRFKNKTVTLIPQSNKILSDLAAEIRSLGYPAIDIVVYSNDEADIAKNRVISLKRAKYLKQYFKDNFCNVEYCVPVAWGVYSSGFNLYNETNDISSRNKVQFIIRTE